MFNIDAENYQMTAAEIREQRLFQLAIEIAIKENDNDTITALAYIDIN